MRITEGRMIDLAARRTGDAQERVARSGDTLSSGLRVDRPSDDPAAWAAGKRAALRRQSSEARGTAIGRATDRLGATDAALGTVGQVFSRMKQLAVQAANDTNGAQERATIAREVRALGESALAAANRRGPSGEFLLAGSQGDTEPFDATGAYDGDGLTKTIETAEDGLQTVSVPGQALTAAEGVDVLAVAEQLATALEADDTAGIQTSLGDIGTAIDQVARARSSAGAMAASLETADEARTHFEMNLTEAFSRAVEADAISAASDLAQAGQSLQASQAVTTRILELTRPRF